MKKIIIKASLSIAILACSLGAQAQISVKGQLKGIHSNKVIVYTYDPITEKSTNDTVTWKKGKFELNYPTKNLLLVNVAELPQDGSRWNDGISLYLMPNKPAIISGTFEKYTIKGDDIYNKVKAYEDYANTYQKPLNKLNNDYEKELKNAKTDEAKKAVRDKYFPEMRRCSLALRENVFNFIKQNPDNEASCVAINSCKDFFAAYNLLTNRVKNSEMSLAYKRTKTFADKRKKSQEQEKKLVEGVRAPEFTLKDINGNDFKLSSLLGKYVMLDFWGSWCGWCIKALPNLKECYNKHKDSGKFEIVSIDCNDTEAKWKAAVKQHDMAWTQVKSEKQNDIATLYGVSGYPTFIIINPEGKIIKRYVGSEPAMYTYVDSLFE